MSSACILVRLSAELAEQFPPERGQRAGEGPPHVTVAYVPDPTAAMMGDISAALRSAALVGGPFSLALTGGLHLFPPNAEGETPVCIAVQSEGLLGFRRRFLADLGATQPAAADAADNAHGGYVPHATVLYAALGEPTEVDPRPRGGMIVEAIELWAGDVLHEVVRLAPAAPKPIALSQPKKGARHRSALQFEQRAPAGVATYPKAGLKVGRPFRVMTAGRPIFSGAELLHTDTLDELHEMVQVFNARAARGEGLPKLNWDHGPSREGGDRTLYGEVCGLYVADDGRRGPGLYVVPAYTPAGWEKVGTHESEDGSASVLYSSPELLYEPAYARSGMPGETSPALLGNCELTGLALTGNPVQSEDTIDAVLRSRATDLRAIGAGGVQMEDGTGAPVETTAPEAAGGDLAVRVDSLEAGMAKLAEGQDATAAALSDLKDMVAKAIKGGADEAVSEAIGEQLPEELSLALSQIDPAQLAPAAVEEMSKDPAKVAELSRKLSNVVLLSRKHADKAAANAAAVERKRAEEEAKQLRSRMETMERNHLHERAASAVERLMERGAKPADREDLRQLYLDAHGPSASEEGTQLRSRLKKQWDNTVKAIEANPPVDLQMRGRGAEPGGAQGPDAQLRSVQAWAEKNGFNYARDPYRAADAYNAAHPGRGV